MSDPAVPTVDEMALVRSLKRLHRRIGIWDWDPNRGKPWARPDYRFKAPPSDPKAKPVEYRCGACQVHNGLARGRSAFEPWPCPTMRRVLRHG